MYFNSLKHFRGGIERHVFYQYRTKAKKNAEGRPTSGKQDIDYKDPIARFFGTISNASQKEIEYHKQIGHPISHEIIVYHRIDVKPEDIITLENRKFYVQSVRDPGELGIVTCIYTEEKQALPKMERHHRR